MLPGGLKRVGVGLLTLLLLTHRSQIDVISTFLCVLCSAPLLPII